MTAIATSPIKYVGGKRKLAAQIIASLGPIDSDRDVYFEPFLGGGSVFFALRALHPRLHCVLSDVNEEIINLYRVLRDDVEGLIKLLSNETRYRYDREVYYALRSVVPNRPTEQAARTIYLNKCGFNGLYRTNLKGEFNVPFGAYDNPRILDAENLRLVSIALQDATVSACDFASVEYVKHAVVYCDPPYMPVSKTASFTAYAGLFGLQQQQALARLATSLVERGHRRVVLSNSDVPAIRDLYAGRPFDLVSLSAARNVSCKGDKRGRAQELLIVGKPTS